MTSMGISSKARRTVRSMWRVGALASLTLLGIAPTALATKPTGDFANFGSCPLKNSATSICIFGQTTSGEFKIGSTAVPITKTVVLQGGLTTNEATGEEKFLEAENGETLSKTPQTVPGGLLKIMSPEFFPEPLKKIFNEFIDKGITGVNATTELVGEVKFNLGKLLTAEGVGLVLPVRVHLENEFLGPKCYLGSKAHPITLELTEGTTNPPAPNKPIKGSAGELEIKDEGNLIIVHKNSLVNNSFGVPKSEGCGSQILFGLFTGVIDEAVNAQLGLPSEPGHNTAILSGNQELATASAVQASEK